MSDRDEEFDRLQEYLAELRSKVGESVEDDVRYMGAILMMSERWGVVSPVADRTYMTK